jgi:intracellular sulfur oxidation DsrE/DsrF family protein
MNIAVRLLGVVLLLASALALSQALESDDSRFVADIELQTADEFLQLLQRADQLLVEGVIAQDPQPRITFLLHGPVLRDLLRQSYLKNRELVDLAASLSALQVVEIKACQTWMAGNGVNAADLQPFIETVPFAAGEVERLLAEKHYIRF